MQSYAAGGTNADPKLWPRSKASRLYTVSGAISPSHGERGSASVQWKSGAIPPVESMPWAKPLVRSPGAKSP